MKHMLDFVLEFRRCQELLKNSVKSSSSHQSSSESLEKKYDQDFKEGLNSKSLFMTSDVHLNILFVYNVFQMSKQQNYRWM